MKYFNSKELGTDNMEHFHPTFIVKLIKLREDVNEPFIPTSCARSAKKNNEVRGRPKSLHIYDELPYKHLGQKGCMAIDVAITSPRFKVKLIETALKDGWSVGINDKKSFVHLDRRVDIGLPKAIFSY